MLPLLVSKLHSLEKILSITVDEWSDTRVGWIINGRKCRESRRLTKSLVGVCEGQAENTELSETSEMSEMSEKISEMSEKILEIS